MRRFVFGPAVVLALGVLAAACDENLADVAGPTPNLAPTFSSIQREIFQPTCANCHNPGGGAFRQVGLDFTSEASYAQMVNVPSVQRPGVLRVAAGDPGNSYLIQKLEGHSGIIGLRMPRNGPPFLTEGQTQIIRRWIARGAPRD